jgi:hypothetical protein
MYSAHPGIENLHYLRDSIGFIKKARLPIGPLCKDAPIRAPSTPAAISWSRPFWADCTINMGGFDFPTGKGTAGR